MSARVGLLSALGAAWLFAASAAAASPDAAVVYNFTIAGKFDKSFSQAAFEGVLAARADGAVIVEFEPESVADEARALADAARVADHVIAIGFAYSDAVSAFAPEAPDIRFTVIDGDIPSAPPNVSLVRFAEEEGSFLAGALAAMKSRTGRIAFVGGMDAPVIRRFLAGYRAGARHVDPSMRILWAMAGDTPAAFAAPFDGWLLAKGFIDGGADVVFAAAGATGLGAYLAAAEHGALAIGVDSNQNFLHPGAMLTSMRKRIDRAVALAVARERAGDWRAGLLRLGLAEDGVGLAMDDHNQSLIAPAERDRLEAVRKALISGEISLERSGGA